MIKKILIPGMLLCLFSGIANAQNFNPRPGWKDSYSVGGRCYCDSSNYDHGLDRKSANTPDGRKNVKEICADIKRVLGTGSRNGRIPYNDIQCGHGPANDAADETGCPGRVDIGSRGCNDKGPKWDLNAVYGSSGNNSGNEDNGNSTPRGALDRSRWAVRASNNGGAARAAIDGRNNTRWSTRTRQRNGQSFEIDMKSRQSITRIELDTRASSKDGPRRYTIQVSNNRRNWTTVKSGTGSSLTRASFSKRDARYIRILQSGSDRRFWWSIHEVNVYN